MFLFAFFDEGSAYQVDCTSYTLVGAGHVLFTRPLAEPAAAATGVPAAAAAVVIPVVPPSSPASSSTAVSLTPGAYPFQLGS